MLFLIYGQAPLYINKNLKEEFMFKIKLLYKQAEKLSKTIVFPEAAFSARTLEAVKIVAKKKIAKPILIGDESAIILADKHFKKFQIINPKTFEKTKELAKSLYQKRKEKGLTLEQAQELILDPYYFATMLVSEGYAEGMVAGAEASTAKTIKPALQLIKGEKKGKPISSCFLIYGKNKFLDGKTLIVSDAGLLPNPTTEELSEIAYQSLSTYCKFGLTEFQEPKIAFLSYSSKGSAKGEEIDKVRKACEKFKKEHSPIKVGVAYKCDGELQFDAAMVKEVAAHKCPESEVGGDANILIYPNLETGNVNYKTMQYIGGLNAVGPILQGLKKPVNDLSRGASVKDIVAVTAITALQSNKED